MKNYHKSESPLHIIIQQNKAGAKHKKKHNHIFYHKSESPILPTSKKKARANTKKIAGELISRTSPFFFLNTQEQNAFNRKKRKPTRVGLVFFFFFVQNEK